MEFIKCKKEHFDAVMQMYDRSVQQLEATVNYPKWSKDHPGREYIAASIERGEQFACVQDGEILGAAVLSEDPEGSYEAGEWSADLQCGEYLIIHTLAADPNYKHKGIGSFLVDNGISYAKEQGYKAIRLDVVPDNYPAANLYKKKGFTYAGTKDLQRHIDYIPLFDLYELNF